jgi:hypothetical protein
MSEAMQVILSEAGLVGALFVLSVLGNIFQYRAKEKMHEQNRENDKETMGQLFEAISFLKDLRASVQGRGGS